MHYLYCPQCGSKLVDRHAGDDGNVPYCESCQKMWFDTFADCVIVLIHNELGEVVVCRQLDISDEYLTLTSGYITPGESVEDAARREVEEELGLVVQDLRQAGTYWFEQGDMMMHAYIGFCSKQDFVLSEEIDAAWWVTPKEAAERLVPDRVDNAAQGALRTYVNSIAS